MRTFADWAIDCGGQGLRVEQPADLDPAFRAAFAKTDGPTLVECVVDPDEAPLPPKISTEHAINSMKALARGQEHPIRIATTMSPEQGG